MTARRKKSPAKDVALRKRMRELVDERKRYEAPRLHVLLKQEGLVVNHKRTERIYREEKLNLRRARKKHRVAESRKQEENASGPAECLGMDFVHDNLADGRTIRILSLIDLWDRSCPMLRVGFSQFGQGVINALNRLAELGRLPRTMP